MIVPPQDQASDPNAEPVLCARPMTVERRMANAARVLALDYVAPLEPEAAGSAMRRAMRLADLATLLWSRTLKADTADPLWPDRDRVVLSAAGAAPLLQAILEWIARPGENPPAIDAPPGPPGQGVAIAVGMALAERLLAARFGKSLVDHRVWALAEAEELEEGVAHEAACLAGQLRLEKLTLIAEEGTCPAQETEERLRRFTACGWAVKMVDGLDQAECAAALSAALRSRKPMLIACRAGLPDFADPGAARQAAGWDARDVREDIPAELGRLWRAAGGRGSKARRGWLKRLARHALRAEFERVTAGRLPDAWLDRTAAGRGVDNGVDDPAGCPAAALRGDLLAALSAAAPELIYGSTETCPAEQQAALVEAGNFNGWQIPFGGREHGMAAMMNGVALHGGLIACGGARLAAGDYLRPALLQAARLRQRVCCFLAGAGDAAAETLAALRATPHLHVFHPADAAEAAECWDLAMRRVDGPSVIVLSNGLAARGAGRRDGGEAADNRAARGGYVVAEADGPRQATLVASGPVLRSALEARALLEAEGVAVAVISLPCWELFAMQDEAWRAALLGTAPRLGMEVAGSDGAGGWDRWLGENGALIALPPGEIGAGLGFTIPGAAASGYRERGITPETILTALRRRLDRAERDRAERDRAERDRAERDRVQKEDGV